MRLSCNLYLTNKCNFQCAHCCHESGPRETHMVPERITWIYDWLSYAKGAGNDFDVIGLTGGEPMLHPQFYNTVFILTNLFHTLRPERFELFTNGSIPFDYKQWPMLIGVFSTVFVTTDNFHQKFKKFKDLELESLNLFTFDNLVIRHTRNIANLGRAKQYIKEQEEQGVEFFKGYKCTFESMPPETININFCPETIRFCWDNSHESENTANHVDYSDRWLKHPNELIKLAEDYRLNHSGKNCATRCTRYIIDKATSLNVKEYLKEER